MSSGPERPYLSIGEVLELLKEEFPDVSISRIRTLEAQGLLQLERTASGYRKFYDADVNHLRSVLRQHGPSELSAGHTSASRGATQPGTRSGSGRTEESGEAPDEHHALEFDGGELPGQPERRHPASFNGGQRTSTPPRTVRPGPAMSAPPGVSSSTPSSGGGDDGPDVALVGALPTPADLTPADLTPEDLSPGAAVDEALHVSSPTEAQPRLALVATPASSATPVAVQEEAPEAAAPVAARPPSGPLGSRNPLATNPSALNLSLDELCKAAGVAPEQVRELEGYGLLRGHSVFSTVYYDEDALLTCRLVAEFQRFGVEPRHLRMYKLAADREAAFFEQVVTPQLRRRNADAKDRAIETLGELVRLGEQLRVVALRQVLRAAVDPK